MEKSQFVELHGNEAWRKLVVEEKECQPKTEEDLAIKAHNTIVVLMRFLGLNSSSLVRARSEITNLVRSGNALY